MGYGRGWVQSRMGRGPRGGLRSPAPVCGNLRKFPRRHERGRLGRRRGHPDRIAGGTRAGRALRRHRSPPNTRSSPQLCFPRPEPSDGSIRGRPQRIRVRTRNESASMAHLPENPRSRRRRHAGRPIAHSRVPSGGLLPENAGGSRCRRGTKKVPPGGKIGGTPCLPRDFRRIFWSAVFGRGKKRGGTICSTLARRLGPRGAFMRERPAACQAAIPPKTNGD